MAEGALFSLATKLVSTLVSLASKEGHERAYVAKVDIKKLTCTVQTIRDVISDAERKQDHSAAVKGWIKRIEDVLYDVEDLLDEISTNVQVKQQTEGCKIKNQVRGFFSPLNSLAYAYRIRARFKALRESLDLATSDASKFGIIVSQRKEQMSDVRGDRCEVPSFLYSEEVIGRKHEKNDILNFLLNESWHEENNVPVIAIAGIGGMGKTTLAQLVYHDELVKQNFEERWWASTPNTPEDKENLRMIYRAMNYRNARRDLDRNQLTDCIRKTVREAGKYLLVIDDAWDENQEKWSEQMGLLRNGCVGCRIIVTTRSLLVARAVGAVKTYTLSGLSDENSWKLFKTIAFTSEEEEDPRWTSLGRGIVKQCSGVPLAITRIAGHLHGRSMEEWECFMSEELSKVELSADVVMSVLKLSYDRLPSELKHCFAYCALFPKGFAISKQKLLHLWIAQGYVMSHSYTDKQTVEEIGDAYLKRLLSVFFLEKAGQDEFGEIEHYKMHDLLHDLAQLMAGEEVAVLTNDRYFNRSRSPRHASVGYDIFQSSETLAVLPGLDRLRSCLFFEGNASRGSSLIIPRQLLKLRCLRALDLCDLGVKDVPRSIGGLVHLRYLNLSGNDFESLPDSISQLLNLITLDISWCLNLKAWPRNMRRLIKLRHLDFSHCHGLEQMPDGFGALTNLQHLSDFKPSGDRTLLEAFSKLTLKGKLRIDFAGYHVQENDVHLWQLPATIRALEVCRYPGESLPRWCNEMPAAIVRLELYDCEKLKRLPDLRILRNLKTLVVCKADVLEYVEDTETTSSMSSFFPSLENLRLVRLPELKGWSRTVKLEGRVFPELKYLEILECPGMEFWGGGNKGIDWDSLSALQFLEIQPMPTPESLPDCLLKRDVRIMKYHSPAAITRGNTTEQATMTSSNV